MNQESKIHAIEIPDAVLTILGKLKGNGYQAYIVGGAVRDSLLGANPKDWDIATDAMPDKIRSLFSGITSFNLKHGTVTLVMMGKQYEITTFRNDCGFAPSIEEDLAHRDFTFNAMGYDVAGKRVIDLFCGKRDLKERVVRAVLDPGERFLEDPLRMIRAVRFSLCPGYSIEKETSMAISSAARNIIKVAPERIRDELLRILTAKKPSTGLDLMRKTGLLRFILPELLEGFRKRQNDYHKYTVYRHILKAVDYVKNDPILRLAALFHDIAKPRVRKKLEDRWSFIGHERASADLASEIMRRLRFSNDRIVRVTALVSSHMFDYKKELSDKAIRRFIKRAGQDNVINIINLRKADELAHGRGRGFEEEINIFQERVENINKKSPVLTISGLAVNGCDIMEALRMEPGRRVGKILERLLEVVVEKPEYNRKDKLLEIALSLKQV